MCHKSAASINSVSSGYEWALHLESTLPSFLRTIAETGWKHHTGVNFRILFIHLLIKPFCYMLQVRGCDSQRMWLFWPFVGLWIIGFRTAPQRILGPSPESAKHSAWGLSQAAVPCKAINIAWRRRAEFSRNKQNELFNKSVGPCSSAANGCGAGYWRPV